MYQRLAALLIRSKLLNHGHQIFIHRITAMPKKKPSQMTNKELAKHVFHPKVLEHAKKHLEELNAAPKTAPKPKKKAI